MDLANMFRLDHKAAVVVGGCGGLGVSICLALAACGADVAVADKKIDSSDDLIGQIKKAGRKAIAVGVDVLNEDHVKRLMETVASSLGGVDILVNAVGTQIWQKAEEMTSQTWDKVLDLNLKGAFLLSREAGRYMIGKRAGKIIHITSVRGQLGYPENYTAYCASKGGLNMYVKCLAAEWAKYGINVNAIAPTFVETPLTKGMLEDEKVRTSLLNRIPLRRLGTPNDVAAAAAFLASPASDFVTGHVLLVDGGVTCTQ